MKLPVNLGELNILIEKLETEKLLLFNKDNLSEFLQLVQVLSEQNTFISGMIRILKFNNSLMIQELTTKDEVILRKFESIKDAEFFMEARLQKYEKMWDGCGCKVNYYE